MRYFPTANETTSVRPHAPSPDASLGADIGSSDAGAARATSDAAAAPTDEDSRAPVTCTWTRGDHATACPTVTCPIVEDVGVTCTDDHFGWPGLRVAPAPDATWLVTASANERYAFSIKDGSGSAQQGLPALFADQMIWLALTPDGHPALATDTAQDFCCTSGGQTGVQGGTQYEALGPNGWFGWPLQSALAFEPIAGLQVASDGTPNVWLGDQSPKYQLAIPGDGGAIFTDAAVPVNGEGDNVFTLARNGEPVSLDVVAGPGMTALLIFLRRPSRMRASSRRLRSSSRTGFTWRSSTRKAGARPSSLRPPGSRTPAICPRMPPVRRVLATRPELAFLAPFSDREVRSSRLWGTRATSRSRGRAMA